jgi:hypothetical protein
VFRRACKLGLKGIVSKRLSAPVTGLDQDQEPRQPGDAATLGRDLVAGSKTKKAPASPGLLEHEPVGGGWVVPGFALTSQLDSSRRL